MEYLLKKIESGLFYRSNSNNLKWKKPGLIILFSMILLFPSVKQAYGCGAGKPSGTISADKATPCVGETVTFTLSNQDNVESGTWDFGTDATPATATTDNVAVSYSTSGSKSIKCVLKNGNKTANATPFNVTVYSSSSAPTSISGTKTICSGSSTTLTTNGGSLGGGAEDVWYEGACVSEAFTEEWNTQPYTIGNMEQTFNDGILNVTSKNADPGINMTSVGSFNASTYKYIQIKYKVTNGTAGEVQIYYSKTNGTDLSETQVVKANLISDNAWHVVNVDMSTSANWSGTITGWRFDWCSASGVTMDIDFITLADRPIIGTGSSIVVSPTSSTTYYTAKKGECNTTSCVNASVTVNPNLSAVSISPTTSQSFCESSLGSQLTASETGGGTITARQWGKRSTSGGAITSISGETGSTYTPSGTSFGSGTWYVVCTSTPTCGSAIVSNEVTVTVNPSPTMSSANAKTICSGANVSLALTSVVPSGYSWIATANANVTGESTSAQTSATISDVLVNTTSTVQN
ncbi:MAG TPA: PKD-like domain-containing protein, partial [Prolixibacteraceae bacterium]|nr:PKD-like domain-containing protein [Prolixibacteraceae bacterium]